MSLKHILIAVLCLLSLNAFAIPDLGPQKKLFKVNSIKVEGLKKVELEAILDKVNIEKGQYVDNYALRKSISKIYSLKYFEYVEAHQKKNGVLLYKVKEKPIISNIVFKGNSELDRDDLMTHVKTKEYSILDINTIKNDVIAIQKEYEEKGYYLARVNYSFKKTPKGNLELVYNIKEYDKVLVKKISFLGNKSFQDSELMAIMETREESLFSFMSGSGNFKEFNFQTDIERLKYFYKTKGYLQVNVGSPEITVSEDKKWVFITMKVTEGPQFTVNNIFFQGEILFTDSELRENLQLKTGETYSEELLRFDIQYLTEKYQDKGYAFANVLRTLQVVPGENKVDIEYSFEKGKIAHFGNITVKGNSKTRDKVVRRELLIHEGMKFSGSMLRRSKENVNRLGFFEPNSIIFNTVSPQGADDVLDVEIQVKERNTGQISVGAGYSTATGGFMQASIAQNNFRGLGQNLSFTLSFSRVQQNFNIGFTEPYLFDSKWTGGGDIFHTKNEGQAGFVYQQSGFDLRVGYPIFDYTRLFATYKLQKTKISNIEDPSLDPNVENGISSSVRFTLLKDKRDNTFEPTKGHFISLSTEYSGLGFDHKWYKNELDTRYFKRVVGDLIFRSRFYVSKLETIDSTPIPRAIKYSLGGSRNLRGYDIDAIGPKRTGYDSRLGRNVTFNVRGLFSTFATIEFEHPLAREAGLKWVVFADAGHVGRYSDIRLYKDYGFGFRWFSPIGVLRFEFGYPLDDVKDDPTRNTGSQFHFDIGQLF